MPIPEVCSLCLQPAPEPEHLFLADSPTTAVQAICGPCLVERYGAAERAVMERRRAEAIGRSLWEDDAA